MKKDRNATLCKVENIINDTFGPRSAEWGYVNDQLNTAFERICENYFNNNFDKVSDKIKDILANILISDPKDYIKRNLYILTNLVADVIHKNTNLLTPKEIAKFIEVEFVEPKYPSRFCDEILRLSLKTKCFINVYNAYKNIYNKPIYLGDNENLIVNSSLNIKDKLFNTDKVYDFPEFYDLSYLQSYLADFNYTYSVIYKQCEEIIRDVFKNVY